MKKVFSVVLEIAFAFCFVAHPAHGMVEDLSQDVWVMVVLYSDPHDRKAISQVSHRLQNAVDETTRHLSLRYSLAYEPSHDEMVSFFGRFPYLTSLSLRYNPYIKSEGLSNLTNLRILDLTGNTMINNEALGAMTALTSLDLTNNPVITKGISNLTNLTHLNLSHNTAITNDVLSKLTNLTQIKR